MTGAYDLLKLHF